MQFLGQFSCSSEKLHWVDVLGLEMVISVEKDEEIKLHSENEKEILGFPTLPAISIDVTIVPEHEKSELENPISNLEGEIKELRLKQRYLDKKRREALDKKLDIKGCIRVFCRIQPLLSTNRKIHRPIVVDSEKISVGSMGNKREFGFDKVFTQETTQDDVFSEVKPILRSAMDGHNACVLAYGQTGTGKTYTMDGTNDSPGIVPRALEELFRQSSLDNSVSFSFSISMLEVYLGNIKDLLAPKPLRRTMGPIAKCNLNIQTDPKGLVEIEGLLEAKISNFTKASWWYSKGRRARSMSSTNVNVASSRSHCLTRINIFRRGDGLGEKVEVSKLWMVDLGGSERLLKTGATGQTLDEGRAINLSLSALGDVIAALRRRRGHVPYRNCKLTQILKDSLGYGSKVIMLVHVSQYEEDVAETTCSLTFAQRARGIESTRELPEGLKRQKEKKIAELEAEITEAEVNHRNITNQIQKAELLLLETRQLFSTKYELVEDYDQTPTSEKEELKETPKTPIICETKAKKKGSGSLPRFMNATMASRQRQSAAEREIEARAKLLRSWARNSVNISGSHSQSFLDPHLKAILRNSNKKWANREKVTPLIETTRFNTSDPQAKAVRSSDPNVKVTIGCHRRGMSNMI